MSIVTDSTPMEAPKNPDNDNVFNIYKLVASREQTEQLRQKYLAGNYGYGHAKQELLELLLTKFANERELYNIHINNRKFLDDILMEGAKKAKVIGQPVLQKVREKVGY